MRVCVQYIVAIFKYFHSIVVGLYGPLLDRVDMCQLVDLIFSEKNTLYLNTIMPPKPRRSAGQSAQKQVQTDEEKKRQDMKDALSYEYERVTQHERI